MQAGNAVFDQIYHSQVVYVEAQLRQKLFLWNLIPGGGVAAGIVVLFRARPACAPARPDPAGLPAGPGAPSAARGNGPHQDRKSVV